METMSNFLGRVAAEGVDLTKVPVLNGYRPEGVNALWADYIARRGCLALTGYWNEEEGAWEQVRLVTFQHAWGRKARKQNRHRNRAVARARAAYSAQRSQRTWFGPVRAWQAEE